MHSRSTRLPGHWRTIGSLLLSGLALAACSGAHEPAHGPSTSPLHSNIEPTTNVPALLGSSIDVLRQRLGPSQPVPVEFSDPVMNFNERAQTLDSAAAFRTGGLLLVANYDARSGQVHDLLLLGHHEDSLMRRASLRSNAADYLVMPVFYTGSRNRLMGLRVVSTSN